MSESVPQKTVSASTPALPLFYRQPEPLSSAKHGDIRLTPGNVDFAADCNAVPLMLTEFAAAARHYPIVFSDSDTLPAAVLGLERRNLFMEGGDWKDDTYIPAYVRRYPFVFFEAAEGEFALGIDAAAERFAFGGTDGHPLFEDGKPTTITRDAFTFCDAFRLQHLATLEFSKALKEKGLLVSQQMQGALPGGRKMSLAGFQIVDRERFRDLDEATVLDWHKRGWLGWVALHHASLDRFSDLLRTLSVAKGEEPLPGAVAIN